MWAVLRLEDQLKWTKERKPGFLGSLVLQELMTENNFLNHLILGRRVDQQKQSFRRLLRKELDIFGIHHANGASTPKRVGSMREIADFWIGLRNI